MQITQEENIKSEDKIKNIYTKINEIKSYANVMICAAENEFNRPDFDDIIYSLNILYNQINHIIKLTEDYMNYCSINDLYD